MIIVGDIVWAILVLWFGAEAVALSAGFFFPVAGINIFTSLAIFRTAAVIAWAGWRAYG